MPEIIETLKIGADAIILLGAFWISWIFWRTYSRTRTPRSASLSGIFALLGLYFVGQVVLVDVLNLSAFHWLESNEALEIMLIITLVSLAITLTFGGSWRGTRLIEKKEKKAA